MSTIQQQFGGGFEQNIFGLVTGSVTAAQFLPSGTVGMIRFKALPSNLGYFYLGNQWHQTFPMDAGDDTGWIDLDRLEQIWFRAPSGSSVYLSYWLQR